MSKRWKYYTINIGEVKQKTKQQIIFESSEDLDISTVSFGCSICTKFIDYKDKKLTIQYTVEDYPRHLIGFDSKPIIDKRITVHLNNGESDTLRILGNIKR